ncbi:MAG: hypothetical protein K2G06_09555 [Muribaculaceae bacterium]|nr:hypothetical protein [Muribaculaceae bacterium]
MRKILTLIILATFSLSVYAQKDVTKFLGIPVDGTKSEMIQKLKEKGFTPSAYNREVLQGEFNGHDVHVHIGTNGNKVYRIMVADANPTNEANIKIRFNNLCRQFKRNNKYISLDDYTIPEDERISTQMTVYNKRFQASFYQQPEMLDTVYAQQELLSRLNRFYTPEQLENPTEEIKAKLQETAFEVALELYQKKTVWFMISKDGYDEYSILMYYDNKYNHADGEDL